MKRIAIATTLLLGCTSNADIGISSQPVTCQAAAAGATVGTITTATTSHTFGAAQASLVAVTPGTAGPTTVALNDSALELRLQFSCGPTELATYEVGTGQAGCPLNVYSSIGPSDQQYLATGFSGPVIIDENVGCLAGRYDVHYGTTNDNARTFVDEGEVAGWFSVPLQ